MTAENLALRYRENGKPGEVLCLEELPYPSLGEGEVCLRLLASPVHPSDLGMIAGTYGKKRNLPATGGREGLGEVVEVGPEVSGIRVGERFRIPESVGCWQRFVAVAAADLWPVPKDLPVEQASMSFVNPPTALRLLEDFVDLQPGDWMIQNAGNSAVGFAVNQLAAQRGIKVVNLVRDESWKEPLQEAGAELVFTESEFDPRELRKSLPGAGLRLGLNSVGGNSVSQMIKSVGDGATVVTFGGMVGDPVRFPTRYLIFNDLRLVGFWMDRWYRTQPKSVVKEMMAEIYDDQRTGLLQVPIDQTYPLEKGTEAVARAATSGRRGKVLITG
ncbi:MAG: 2-enoyl thioester reductase domain-containing protein [Opitutales bacterium]|nr:2-enoyl thioester reductase domain-containing protein [Opitutales bacterium]